MAGCASAWKMSQWRCLTLRIKLLAPVICLQMVSLLHLANITEEGVQFASPVDGSLMLLTPEHSMAIQNRLGASDPPHGCFALSGSAWSTHLRNGLIDKMKPSLCYRRRHHYGLGRCRVKHKHQPGEVRASGLVWHMRHLHALDVCHMPAHFNIDLGKDVCSLGSLKT